MSTPITVNASPLPATLASILRTLFVTIGTWAVAKGWISAEHVEGYIASASIIATAAYGVWKQFSKSSDLATVVPYVPSDIAKVKGQ